MKSKCKFCDNPSAYEDSKDTLPCCAEHLLAFEMEELKQAKLEKESDDNE